MRYPVFCLRAVSAVVLALASLCCTATGDLRGLPRLEAGSTRFLLVRHGEAYTNLETAEARSHEDADRLTSLGRSQAQRTAAALASFPVGLLVSSPRGRTRETADELAAKLPGVPRRTEPRIGPLDQGRAPDGHHLSWREREEEWEHGRDPVPPHGESVAMLGARGVEAVRDLAREMPGRVLLLVTHNELVAAVAAIADGKVPVKAFPPRTPHASVTVLDCAADGRLHVVRRNVVP